MLRSFLLVAVGVLACGQAFAGPISSGNSAAPVVSLSSVDPLQHPNALLVFGGAMSTRSFGSTMRFDTDFPVGPNYDNYILGLSYQRSLYRLGYGFALGVEIGAADRFGVYKLCCDLVIRSDGMIHSPEVWGGGRISFDGIMIANTLRIGGALTVGLSATTSSIGRERERELSYNGSGRLLGYLGPELSFSLVDHPEWELVYRVHHRSGANGTFGNLREGYNANTLGVRYSY